MMPTLTEERLVAIIDMVIGKLAGERIADTLVRWSKEKKHLMAPLEEYNL
jgi:hypothetical protein